MIEDMSAYIVMLNMNSCWQVQIYEAMEPSFVNFLWKIAADTQNIYVYARMSKRKKIKEQNIKIKSISHSRPINISSMLFYIISILYLYLYSIFITSL